MQIITIINIYSPKNYEQTQRERRLKESPKPAVPEAAGGREKCGRRSPA